MENYKIMKRREPVLVGRKVKCIGDIYYEIAVWDGHYWNYLKERPASIAEAKKIVLAIVR